MADPLWDQLTHKERHVLDRLLGGGVSPMTADVAGRLIAFGLVERLLGSYALTRTGRDLMLSHLGWKAP